MKLELSIRAKMHIANLDNKCCSCWLSSFFSSYNGMGFAWKPPALVLGSPAVPACGAALGWVSGLSMWGISAYRVYRMVCPGVCVVPARVNQAPACADPRG